MKSFANILRENRELKKWKLKEVAAKINVDQALISKFEKGSRMPTEKQVDAFAKIYDLPDLRKHWLAEKIVELVEYEIQPEEIFAFAETRVEYLRSNRALKMPGLSDSLIEKLDRIDQLKLEWKMKKPLNNTQLIKMSDFFKIEYTYESNRIEGNTLSLQETELVINQGLTISGKSMTEHLEAVNHAEAVDFVAELVKGGEDFSKRNVLQLHSLILSGIDRENAGRYRSVPVRISGSKHEPPQPFLLEKLMEDYFLHFSKQKNKLHPVILAADMHERLVSIHPFIDGNGRTSRLVMNLILLRNGFTIANLKGDLNSRMKYYRALEAVQVDNEPKHFYDLVIDSVEESLKAHLALV